MLDVIRGIRNHFAHHFKITSFPDQSIRGRCRKLISLTQRADVEDKPPRLQYIGGIAFLLGKIAIKLVRATKNTNKLGKLWMHK